MKQAFVEGRAGVTVLEVPAPVRGPGQVLVRNACSLISAGTETTAAGSAGGLLQRAIARPDLVKRVAGRALRRGVGEAAAAVRAKMAQLTPLGYSSAGYVVEVDGEGDPSLGSEPDLRPGQLVACAGAAYAHHAELVSVPRNLVAPTPAGLDARLAAFTTVGAIALQGVRRARPEIGEVVAVVGLGLVGQVVAELLTADGCRVLGFDPRPERVALARAAGAVVDGAPPGPAADALVRRQTAGQGLDAVLLTAATPSSQPVNWAFAACRERGRVVVVGDVGLQLEREPFYRRELDLLISRSYGPGRYDPSYEELGIDYPFGHVRWTENRNMAAFLDLAARGRIQVERLISHTFPLARAREAYEVVTSGAGLGVLFDYGVSAPEQAAAPPRRLVVRAAPADGAALRLGIVGPGHFTQTVHLPNLRRIPGVRVHAVASRSGWRARRVAEQDGAAYCATDYAELLRDPELDAVLIGTRHHLHAAIARQALEAGKHVFVEKPLGLSDAECRAVVEAVERSGRLLTVGFNRRLAPLALRLKAWLEGRVGPTLMHYHVEAGALPAGHWLLDPAEGGGRILGEAVHFFDFLFWLVGAEPVALSAAAPGDADPRNELAAQLRFADGSVATVLYSGRGDAALGKERVSGSRGGGSFLLDEFGELTLADKGRTTRARERADKGHAALLANFVAAARGREPLKVTAADGARATALALASIQSARQGATVPFPLPGESPLPLGEA